MLLPGPEAQQLAVYIGWLLHKTKDGLVAGALFVLPGFISILVLIIIYAFYGNVGVVEGLFFGLKATVLAIVLQAVIRIGSRALKNNVMLSGMVDMERVLRMLTLRSGSTYPFMRGHRSPGRSVSPPFSSFFGSGL